MKIVCHTILLLSFLFVTVAHGQKKYEWKEATSAGFKYKYVTNDPTKTRFYTLKNGLTAIISENHKTPRIGVRIAVRAGSNTDPATHTGLAHYLEHMLFKGTDKFGTLDWKKEKPYLDKIEQLYEEYNQTANSDKRKEIYKEIDKVSGEASKYSIANEYDKLMASLGSQGSNAHTWVEETVYHEDIPTESLDKFLAVEAERFRNPVFRIFHTELEAVYEEKNRSLDNDADKVQETMYHYLFPTHNYGQQTTIGTIEHLKNPSLIAIRKYYNEYYVPNNMAIIMAGDFNPDELIKKIDRSFSYMKPREVKPYLPAPEKPITTPVIKEVLGPSAESVNIGFRSGDVTSRDAMLADLVSSILYNGSAGLIDLNLNKQQKVMRAFGYLSQYKDYGVFTLGGQPGQGQSLEDVKNLLFSQTDLLKKGQFDESLIKAIVANKKLSDMRSMTNNTYRVENLMTSFIQTKGRGWDRDAAWNENMLKVTKNEIVAFANRFFANNYVLIYKRKGEDRNVIKVEKPPISPVETNAGKESPFVAMIKAMPSTPVKPQWLDFNKDLQKGKIGNSDYLYVNNADNQLFTLAYYFKIGTRNNPYLSMAADYLSFLGTDNLTAQDISKQFYDIACSFNIITESETTTIRISGLQENFDKAVALFEQLITNCQPDEKALSDLKSRLLKSRSNSKLNKSAIMMGLTSYALYGPQNPFNYSLSDNQINSATGRQLTDVLHEFFHYRHEVLYFGPKSQQQFIADVSKLHRFPENYKSIPEAVKFSPVPQTSNAVLFADYDMVQSEITWVRNSTAYNASLEPTIDLFNKYFGGGMGSVVFQNIREAKALAYSTFATYAKPIVDTEPFTIRAYVGSQADKMTDAVTAMNELLNHLPESENGFIAAKTNLTKDLETSRITDFSIISYWLALQKRGINYDIRKDVYDAIPGMSFETIAAFHQKYVANQPYTYCIVGSHTKISKENLDKIGPVKTLSLEEIFGY